MDQSALIPLLLIGLVALGWNIICCLGIRQSQMNTFNVAADIGWFAVAVIGNMLFFFGVGIIILGGK